MFGNMIGGALTDFLGRKSMIIMGLIISALTSLAMVIITVGEMVVIPVAQAYVGKAAPEDMRGRYSGVMGFSWMIPWMIGPLLAGLLIDNGYPNWVWYGSAILASISVAGFLWLRKSHDETREPIQQVAVEETR
jgi:MFS family permease